MMKPYEITIEEQVRFSQSMLWELEADYFKNKGINAWTGAVPFFITSNPYITHNYAQIIIRFIQDLVVSKKADLSKPFYILELGTGSGQFSFYCLKQLLRLQKKLKLDHVKICYVMSDFSVANIEFWRQHESLKPFVDQGVLDFAKYNLQEMDDIFLENKKLVLDQQQLTNPLIFIANYVFDSTFQDAFHDENGKVYESLISVITDSDNIKNDRPIELGKIKTNFSYKLIEDIDSYYDKPELNQLLKDYQQLPSGNFCIPIGMFRCLDYLEKLTSGRLMLIATDKAYASLKEVINRGDPYMAFHEGCFSVTANFYSFGRYFQNKGGAAVHQSSNDEINTSVFIMGNTLDELPETSVVLTDVLERFGPGDYFRVHRFLREQDFDIRMCLTQLHIAEWDPYILSVHADNISKNLSDASERVRTGFIEGMTKAADNVYQMPKMRNYYFNIAMVYHITKVYEQAIEFYQKSIQLQYKNQDSGDNFSAHYNMGLCYDSLGKKEQAIIVFEQAAKLRPGDNPAKQWLRNMIDDEG